jgi:hypothetical protein
VTHGWPFSGRGGPGFLMASRRGGAGERQDWEGDLAGRTDMRGAPLVGGVLQRLCPGGSEVALADGWARSREREF